MLSYLTIKTFIISVKGYAIIITLGRIMKRHEVTYNQQKGSKTRNKHSLSISFKFVAYYI